MRFNLSPKAWVMIVITFLFLVVFVGVARAQGGTPNNPKMEELQKLQQVPSNETPDSRRVRLRAIANLSAEIAKEAAKEERDTWPSSMKKAYEEIEKENEARRKEAGEFAQARDSLHLSGCQNNAQANSVEVLNRDLGRKKGLRDTPNAEGVLHLIITNGSDVAVPIRNGKDGPLVANVCSGGTFQITFTTTRTRPGFSETLVAVVQSMGGGTRIETYSFTLNKPPDYNSKAGYERTDTWTINRR